MASLKTAQPCGHAWAWHVEGACQKCRIEDAEKRLEELEALLKSVCAEFQDCVNRGEFDGHLDALSAAHMALKGEDHD